MKHVPKLELRNEKKTKLECSSRIQNVSRNPAFISIPHASLTQTSNHKEERSSTKLSQTRSKLTREQLINIH